MQEIFLSEQLTTINGVATYSQTTDTLIPAANTLILYYAGIMEYKQGMYVRVSGGAAYPVQALLFDSLTLTYRVQVLGDLSVLPRASRAWAIYESTTVTNFAKLDTEDIDITTTFLVADIADISSRKDSITKNIILQGTPRNNQAFGSMFMINRRTSFTIANKLFFNYSPIRTVDCIVYDNFMPILRGQLLVTQIDVNNGTVYYNTTITGQFVGLKTALADRKLSDLNLYDMEHTYNSLAVLDSWGGDTGTADAVGNSRTYWKNVITGVPYTKPFEFGTGYVYPTIDYGERFALDSLNQSYFRFKMQNYRPALYVREYFNRIFKDAGYTYELQGNATFLSRFNKLIIPDARQDIVSLQTGTAGNFSGGAQLIQGFSSGALTGYTAGFTNGTPSGIGDPGLWAAAFRFTSAPNTSRFEIENILYPSDFPAYYPNGSGGSLPSSNLMLRAKNSISISARVQAGIYLNQRQAGLAGQVFKVQLCKRPRPTSAEDSSNVQTWVSSWQVIAEQSFTSVLNVNTFFPIDFIAPVTNYEQGDQVQLRVVWNQSNSTSPNGMLATWDSASVIFPGASAERYNVEVNVGDSVVPVAPVGVGQMDFIKGIIKSLNLYAYPAGDRQKHIIFMQYDDYYALTAPPTISSNALNWTRKIDFASFKLKSNINLPQKYLFTYQPDNDFLNSDYSKKTGEVYGSFKFNDTLGLVAQKTVDTIFSATPPARIPGLTRLTPIIAAGGTSLAAKEKMKSNIRLLYYSGVFYDRSAPVVAEDFWNTSGGPGGSGGWEADDIFTAQWYALCGNYLFSDFNDIFHPATSKTTDLVPVLDVHFGAPNFYYFNPTADYQSVANHYSYYIGQTTELTSPNLHTAELRVLLNEVDINNLSLRVPIFINLDRMGMAYYKILSVEYTNSKTLSLVTLQKLPI